MKFNESELESAVLELFSELDYEVTFGAEMHRDSRDVLIKDDFSSYLRRNYAQENITSEEIESAFLIVSSIANNDLYTANREFSSLLSNGFILKRSDESQIPIHINLLNLSSPQSNLFRVANQFEVMGTLRRIPDTVVFINGLPLAIFEFKSAISENATLHDAYKQLSVRYRRDIPNLLKFNALAVISDGANTKVGSIFSGYEYFYSWRKVEAEDPSSTGLNTLITMVKGLFAKSRFVDVVHNFIFFPDSTSTEEKYLCRYPQYFAARKLFESIKQNMKPHGDGRGGTYFGATGSGKSLTMVYLCRLLIRSKDLANPTILLITDRTDLDEQLSKQFSKAKAFIGEENIVSVDSREDLRSKLTNIKSGGVFLTTIQKFTEDTELLTTRSNVICISDEAHRSQINLEQKTVIGEAGVTTKYGFAKYLHDSLPNATYVGVTGTPVDKTLDVFGPVADAYTLRDSVEDQITVPITYEGRAARVLLDETKLQDIEKFYEQCAAEGSTEEQIENSKRAVANLSVILGDPSRLRRLASDFVEHYENRIIENNSVSGKAIFVCASREIAWNFYNEVLELRPGWGPNNPTNTNAKVKLVMTRNKDDVPELFNLLGNTDYRKALDVEFKDPDSDFKIAIVVDMWLTGFDVPSLDVIYIDKPIQKHSLIQTISRVNRIYPNKDAGLVVDYIGLKKSLNEALAMYGNSTSESFNDIEQSVGIFKDHLELLQKLFHKFDSSPYFSGSPLQRLHNLNDAVEFCQQTEEVEDRFRSIFKTLKSSYTLCSSSNNLSKAERDYFYFFAAVRTILAKVSVGDALDTTRMNAQVTQMITEALQSQGIEDVLELDRDKATSVLNLFKDEELTAIQNLDTPNTKFKLLQKLLQGAIKEFRKTNLVKSVDFSERLRAIVDAYNDRNEFEVLQSHVLDELAERLTKLFEELRNEQKESDALGVTYEERAFFDILKSVSEKYNFDFEDEKLKVLAQQVKAIIDEKSKYTDWLRKEDVKAELRVDLILVLDENGYPPVPKDEVFREIFEQAENFKRYANN